MSHTPDLPEQYVCEQCQSIHAGTVTGVDDGTHHFEAPAECAACGSTTFVRFEQWVHHSTDGSGPAV
jgi:hypothetical protein